MRVACLTVPPLPSHCCCFSSGRYGLQPLSCNSLSLAPVFSGHHVLRCRRRRLLVAIRGPASLRCNPVRRTLWAAVGASERLTTWPDRAFITVRLWPSFTFLSCLCSLCIYISCLTLLCLALLLSSARGCVHHFFLSRLSQGLPTSAFWFLFRVMPSL